MKKVLLLNFCLLLSSVAFANSPWWNVEQIDNIEHYQTNQSTVGYKRVMLSSCAVTLPVSIVIGSSVNVSGTANVTGSTVSVLNPSLVEFDSLISTFQMITANESNGVVSYTPNFWVNEISILSEGGYNTVNSNFGILKDIPDGCPVSPKLKRIIKPTFTWTLLHGTTLHIFCSGGN